MVKGGEGPSGRAMRDLNRENQLVVLLTVFKINTSECTISLSSYLKLSEVL